MQAQPDQVGDRRPDGEPGLHYLCAGYKKFFRHTRKYLRAMTTLIENDLPVSR